MSTRLSHPLLRTLLFFVLALAVSLPMPALAAPVRQATVVDEALLVAYYESEAIDDEGIEIIVGLAFYDDGAFELSLNLVDEEEFLSARGEFVETDDGLLLTVLTVEDEPVDELVELEAVWDADDSLVILGGPDGPLGEEDIILYAVALEGEEEVIGLDGVYISAIQPSETSAGVVYLINLLPEGDASMSSDYLDLNPPVFEVGTWVDNGDDTVTLEIVGTVDEEYDEPIIIDFVVGASGELTVADLVLYPLIWLTTDIGAQEEETVVVEYLTYVGEFVMPDTDELVVLTMLLYDDGSVSITDEEGTATVYGEWTLDETTLFIALLEDDDGALEEVIELVFEADEEGAWVAVDYPVDIFGEDGLVFYPVDEDEVE